MLKFFLSSFLALSFISVQAIDQHQVFVQFPTDAFRLSAEAKAQLNQLLQKLPHDFEYEISISGHTDNIGTAGYNDLLGERRAQAVKQYLLSAGMRAELIKLKSFGEYKPLLKNLDEENRSANRRVEVELTVFRFENVEELEAVLSNQTKSQHIIDPLQRSQVEGEHGTALHIPPNSFVTRKGESYTGPVVIELQEALNMGQFISNQLFTKSGDEVLISGGMFKVSASTETGEALFLDSGRSMYATVPAPGGVDPNMQQFVSGSGADWSLTSNSVNGFLDIEMPDHPSVNYYPCALPPYPGYKKPKPVEPEVWTKPREPQAPDPLDYQPEIAWYQQPFAASIREEAQEQLKEAQIEYQEKLALYHKKKDLYDDHRKSFKKACAAYNRALAEWKIARVKDSINHINSEEYQLRLASNKAHYAQAVAEYKVRLEAWQELRAAKMDSAIAAMENKGLVSEQMMSSYIMAVSELSWINIDRFWKMRDSQRQLIVLKDKDEKEERAFMVFKEIKCILPMYARLEKEKRYYEMTDVPKDERFALMAYRVENGRPQVYLENYDPRKEHAIEYKEYSFSEFKALLSTLQS